MYLLYTLFGFILITLSSTVSGHEWLTTLHNKIPAKQHQLKICINTILFIKRNNLIFTRIGDKIRFKLHWREINYQLGYPNLETTVEPVNSGGENSHYSHRVPFIVTFKMQKNSISRFGVWEGVSLSHKPYSVHNNC